MTWEVLKKGITRRGFLKVASVLGLMTVSVGISRPLVKLEDTPRGRKNNVVPREAMYYLRLP